MTPLIWSLVAPFLLAEPVEALWPFKTKRFHSETFVNAGTLGLDGVHGRVVAVGDWNGDSNADLFVLTEDSKTLHIYLWDRSKWKYNRHETLTLLEPIKNVIPGDFNHDGRLDVLLMIEEAGWGNGDKLEMSVFLQNSKGFLHESSWDLSPSTDVQGIIYDADGSLRPSILAFDPGRYSGGIASWANKGDGLVVSSLPLQDSGKVCNLASPHSSAFIDLNGDCLPDLVLHCTRPRSSHHSLQIWLNRGTAGYELSRTYDLPKGSGPITFADMNRDGNIDILYPTCSRHSTSSGVGTDCSINIAYNQQIPICGTEGSQLLSNGTIKCRGWGELCSADESFSFSFDSGDPTTPGLLLHPPNEADIPLPLRAGDYNLDGYPDILLTIHNTTAAPSNGLFGSKAGDQIKIIENVPCNRGSPGCDVTGKNTRGLRVGGGKGWEALDEIWDGRGASWIDLDDDGSLDIMVHRSGNQDKEKVTFIQNNWYHDAFFLKAQVLNGACDGPCVPAAGGKKYPGNGVSYSGATFKFTVLDTLGRRGAQHVAQLPQTGYHALGMPYSFIGLGRTNNYVERLTVGTSLNPPNHLTDLESIIPNSQILVNPPLPPSNITSQVRTVSTTWRSELFLHPGDWIPYVGAAVVGLVIILAGVVIGLNEREKKEDEKERRRALHAINFQAL